MRTQAPLARRLPKPVYQTSQQTKRAVPHALTRHAGSRARTVGRSVWSTAKKVKEKEEEEEEEAEEAAIAAHGPGVRTSQQAKMLLKEYRICMPLTVEEVSGAGPLVRSEVE